MLSIFGNATLLLLVLMTTFTFLFTEIEMRQAARHESPDQKQFALYAYSNYVRDVFRDAQSRNVFNMNVSPQYAKAHGRNISNAGTAVAATEANVPTSYLQAAAIDRMGLGNVLVKAANGKWYQYVWANPSDTEMMADIARGLSRDRKAFYYIKNGNSLLPAGDPSTPKSIEGGAASVIPNGAIVLINKPIERGP